MACLYNDPLPVSPALIQRVATAGRFAASRALRTPSRQKFGKLGERSARMRRCLCWAGALQSHHRAQGPSWGGGLLHPGWDGLSRLPRLGHLPKTGDARRSPASAKVEGVTRARGVRGSRDDPMTQGPRPRCALGRGVFSRPPSFLLTVQFWSVFHFEAYSRFSPSLLFPTPIQTPTVEESLFAFAPNWAGGAPGRQCDSPPSAKSPGVSATARLIWSVARDGR